MSFVRARKASRVLKNNDKILLGTRKLVKKLQSEQDFSTTLIRRAQLQYVKEKAINPDTDAVSDSARIPPKCGTPYPIRYHQHPCTPTD